MRYRLQVIRTYACAHSAKVVQLRALRHGPVRQLIREAMGVRGLAAQLELAIAGLCPAAEPQHAALLIRQGDLGVETPLVPL
ncbi:hypothetical protein ACH492_13610 [Streptomyces sp. NPDC019443]|uniref:hypothetical protein n=1 Tax=Streptomyces sp. NPDC019443 TaxID=3365061 RepID=UPI0037906185